MSRQGRMDAQVEQLRASILEATVMDDAFYEASRDFNRPDEDRSLTYNAKIQAWEHVEQERERLHNLYVSYGYMRR